MSFKELVKAVSKRTGVSERNVRLALKGFIQETEETLMLGERVLLPGFGTFLSYTTKQRGSAVTAANRQKIKFNQSRSVEIGKA